MTHISGGWEAQAQQSVPGTPPAAAAHPGHQRGHHEEGKEGDKAPAWPLQVTASRSQGWARQGLGHQGGADTPASAGAFL